VVQLLGQWVHRHGVSSLAHLWAELREGEAEGCAWWHEHSDPAAQPEPAPAERLLSLAPPVPPVTRPAPAPSHPALVQLRAWLPDQEHRRAA
jgi:hypothetical protein